MSSMLRSKPFRLEQHGLCRALSYIIQTLSAEPAFGRVLSNPIKSQLPAKWHTGGTAGDFIVNVRDLCFLVQYFLSDFWLLCCVVDLRYNCNHIRDSELHLPCAHHRADQLCPAFQESHCHVICSPPTAVHLIFEPVISACGRRSPTFAVLHVRSTPFVGELCLTMTRQAGSL